MTEISGTRKGLAAGLAALLIGLAIPAVAAESPAGVDPEALATLRRMTDYLAGLQRFALRAHSSLEVVLVSGQKLEYDSDVALTLERPDKLLAVREGGGADQGLYYDGDSLSLHSPLNRYYAVAKPPGTLEGMLDFARDELDLVAPAADLLYRDAFESLTEDLTSGFVVGNEVWLNGQSCTHIALRKPGLDLQFWIANGERPLPVKYVLTTTDIESSPSFSLTIPEWNLAPKVDAETFRFTPPADAKRIEFVRHDPTPVQP